LAHPVESLSLAAPAAPAADNDDDDDDSYNNDIVYASREKRSLSRTISKNSW